jgi:adenine deaminase
MTLDLIKNRTQGLVNVAMGREPADLVIRDGHWVCVQSGEIIPHTDIAVRGERIAYVGTDASHTIGEGTIVIQADGKLLVPGLLDGHMHVESGMVTVTEFVRAVARRGTTGMFIDPHEIANVFGLDGVKLMVDEAELQPIHVWVQVPSCVPSAPGLETPGAAIGPKEITEAMRWDGIIGLGEVMNFPGVFLSDDKMHAEMAAAVAAGKTVGGHYATPELGLPFHGYVAGGPQDDHEGTKLEDALARIRQGMKAMLRYGSGWHDVAAQVKAVTELGVESRHFILCTDDSHAETLHQDGHMDRVVRHAISEGLESMKAIQMATLNTAEHFGLARDVGQIAPGRYADILIVKDLDDFRAEMVISQGKVIAEEGKLTIDMPVFDYPDWAIESIHLGKKITPQDFIIPTSLEQSTIKANVIGVIENQAPSKKLQLEVQVVNGEIPVQLERDILKAAVVERHKGTGDVVVGLVHGFGLKGKCAIGTTVAHDCHHMIVIGTDEEQMAFAANQLGLMGGGQIVVKDSEVLGKVELPIAGIMSNERVEIVAEKAATVLQGFRECGCYLNNPNMQLSFLALVVIPELRISDLGLVDVNSFDFIPVITG